MRNLKKLLVPLMLVTGLASSGAKAFEYAEFEGGDTRDEDKIIFKIRQDKVTADSMYWDQDGERYTSTPAYSSAPISKTPRIIFVDHGNARHIQSIGIQTSVKADGNNPAHTDTRIVGDKGIIICYAVAKERNVNYCSKTVVTNCYCGKNSMPDGCLKLTLNDNCVTATQDKCAAIRKVFKSMTQDETDKCSDLTRVALTQTDHDPAINKLHDSLVKGFPDLSEVPYASTGSLNVGDMVDACNAYFKLNPDGAGYVTHAAAARPGNVKKDAQ
jgi:hypothetical protein